MKWSLTFCSKQIAYSVKRLIKHRLVSRIMKRKFMKRFIQREWIDSDHSLKILIVSDFLWWLTNLRWWNVNFVSASSSTKSSQFTINNSAVYASNLMQSNWFSFNDFESMTDLTFSIFSSQQCHSDYDNFQFVTSKLMQSKWSDFNDFQFLTEHEVANETMQTSISWFCVQCLNFNKLIFE